MSVDKSLGLAQKVHERAPGIELRERFATTDLQKTPHRLRITFDMRGRVKKLKTTHLVIKTMEDFEVYLLVMATSGLQTIPQDFHWTQLGGKPAKTTERNIVTCLAKYMWNFSKVAHHGLADANGLQSRLKSITEPRWADGKDILLWLQREADVAIKDLQQHQFHSAIKHMDMVLISMRVLRATSQWATLNDGATGFPMIFGDALVACQVFKGYCHLFDASDLTVKDDIRKKSAYTALQVFIIVELYEDWKVEPVFTRRIFAQVFWAQALCCMALNDLPAANLSPPSTSVFRPSPRFCLPTKMISFTMQSHPSWGHSELLTT